MFHRAAAAGTGGGGICLAFNSHGPLRILLAGAFVAAPSFHVKMAVLTKMTLNDWNMLLKYIF